jgi:hypothetical protein
MSNLLDYLKNDPEALRALRADAAAVGRAPIDLAKAFMSFQGMGAKLGSEALSNLAGVLGEPVATASPASQPKNLEPTENRKKEDSYQFLQALERIDGSAPQSSSSSSREERRARSESVKDRIRAIREQKAFNTMSDEEMGGFDPVDFEREGLYGTSDVVEFSDDVGVAREAAAQKQREIDAKIDEKFRGAAYGSSEPISEEDEEFLDTMDERAAAEVLGKPRRAAKKAAKVSDSPVEPEIRKKDKRFLDTLDERAAEEVLEEEAQEDYTQQAVDLFKTVHATEFDPKSSMDKGKLEKMKSMLEKQGGLGDMSANQFALQVYRNS